jgi:hypothetical protein
MKNKIITDDIIILKHGDDETSVVLVSKDNGINFEKVFIADIIGLSQEFRDEDNIEFFITEDFSTGNLYFVAGLDEPDTGAIEIVIYESTNGAETWNLVYETRQNPYLFSVDSLDIKNGNFYFINDDDFTLRYKSISAIKQGDYTWNEIPIDTPWIGGFGLMVFGSDVFIYCDNIEETRERLIKVDVSTGSIDEIWLGSDDYNSWILRDSIQFAFIDQPENIEDWDSETVPFDKTRSYPISFIVFDDVDNIHEIYVYYGTPDPITGSNLASSRGTRSDKPTSYFSTYRLMDFEIGGINEFGLSHIRYSGEYGSGRIFAMNGIPYTPPGNITPTLYSPRYIGHNNTAILFSYHEVFVEDKRVIDEPKYVVSIPFNMFVPSILDHLSSLDGNNPYFFEDKKYVKGNIGDNLQVVTEGLLTPL